MPLFRFKIECNAIACGTVEAEDREDAQNKIDEGDWYDMDDIDVKDYGDLISLKEVD